MLSNIVLSKCHILQNLTKLSASEIRFIPKRNPDSCETSRSGAGLMGRVHCPKYSGGGAAGGRSSQELLDPSSSLALSPSLEASFSAIASSKGSKNVDLKIVEWLQKR